MADAIKLLEILFRLAPSLVTLIRGIIDGDPAAIKRVDEILPLDGASETQLNQWTTQSLALDEFTSTVRDLRRIAEVDPSMLERLKAIVAECEEP